MSGIRVERWPAPGGVAMSVWTVFARVRLVSAAMEMPAEPRSPRGAGEFGIGVN